MKRTLMRCCLCLLVVFLCGMAMPLSAQTSIPDESAAQKVPVIDGGAGSCSMELTVTADGKPVYAATVRVHIAYGFGSMRKLNLEAGTNVNGRVKFAGLPSKVRRQTLEFEATKDQLSASFSYDPGTECQATRTMALEKAKPDASK